MSNFLQDFFYKQDQLKIINNAFKGAFDLLNSQIKEVDTNNNISRILTYKRIQFQRIEVTEAMYSLNALLNNSSLMTSIGINPGTSLNQKIDMWNNMSPKEKANLLDIAGYSILLTSYMHLMSSQQSVSNKFNVVDFELCDMYNNPFVKNVDYIFYDNKLFLLREFSLDDSYKRKFLILKDIVLDMNTTEDVLGVPLNIPYSQEFTKTDYNETLKAFIQAAAGGPTLDKLESALNKYKVLQGVRVYDKYSAPDEKKNFWGEGSGIGDLTSFDFLVSLPVSFLYRPEKLEYVQSFFSQIKPAYTNFMFAPEVIIKDQLLLKYKLQNVNTKLALITKNNIRYLDTVNTTNLYSIMKDTMKPSEHSLVTLLTSQLIDSLPINLTSDKGTVKTGCLNVLNTNKKIDSIPNKDIINTSKLSHIYKDSMNSEDIMGTINIKKGASDKLDIKVYADKGIVSFAKYNVLNVDNSYDKIKAQERPQGQAITSADIEHIYQINQKAYFDTFDIYDSLDPLLMDIKKEQNNIVNEKVSIKLIKKG